MIHWVWLVAALSIGLQVGMFVQRKMDQRVMAIMQTSLDEYDAFMIELNRKPKQKYYRTLEEDLDAAKRIV